MKDNIYKDLIHLLSYLEVIVDEQYFGSVRKQILDIANNVKRIGDDNGKQ